MADREKLLLDPNVFIPEGMEDWDYKSDVTDELAYGDASELEGYAEEDFGDADSDVYLIDEGDDSSDDAPMTVDNLSVVSQVLRRAADGSQVVDIIVEVDNVPGVTKYEVRVTKA